MATLRHALSGSQGNLVKQIKPDNTRTLYVGGIYEVNKDSGGSVTGTKTYYPAVGAMRDGSTLYYVLKDHLGSASVLTNASGGIVAGADTRYYPFGEARFSTSSMVTDKLFTGQRQIAELGIYQYGARFYSPKLGRFLSADTIVPGYANPQNLNRFSYTLNNPLRYIDPTGHRACDDFDSNGGCVTAPGGGGAGFGGRPKKPKKDDDGGNDPQDMQTSESGVDFIIYWENAGGYPDQYPYEDMGGTCTIGYGHVLPNGRDGCSGAVKKYYRDHPLSLKGAQDFLEQDLDNAEIVIKRTITADLTQAQFNALVSYIFNSGGESNQPFIKKGIPELINSGNYEAAAEAIASGPITSGDPPSTSDTLIERRQAEAALFLYGTYGNYVP